MKTRMEEMKLESGTFNKLMDQMRSAVSNTSGRVEIKVDAGEPSTEFSSSFTTGNTSVMTMIDGNQRITVRGKEGEKHLKAFGEDGALIFEGPINTENERDALPDKVRVLLKRLETAHQHIQSDSPKAAPLKDEAADEEKATEQPIY